MKKYLFFIFILIGLFIVNMAFSQKTYCNPMNIDYGYTPIPNFSSWGRHRATADPVIVNYKNTFYLFSTNQNGYWWSKDLIQWNFLSRSFLRPWNITYDNLCAPAVGIIGDTMIVMGSTYTSNFTIWMSTDPKNNIWKPWVDSFEMGGWDPAFFTDDDGKLYMYNGSSNTYPLYGIELNRQTAKPIGYRRELFLLEPWRYGWQRFGEHNDNTFLDPFIEGAWMTKHNGKYYLQYGAPGTEFSGYADGVAVGNSPLGFFNNQSDPLSMKLGGFNRGAGHGATFLDNFNNYWHVSSTVVCVKNTFERRLGIWPAGFDKDDKMFCNTAYGDYPHYVPESNQNQWTRSNFTHWMLLNYQKPIEVSSVYQNFLPNFVNDENIKTYWSAASANNNEWLISDLLQPATIEAIQINYADQNVADDHLGKIKGQFHQYKIFTSNDKLSWTLLIDKSKNDKDVPHDYIDLEQPVIARYIKLQNLHMPTGKFAISGFRIFGNGNGSKPDTVKDFVVLRTNKDKRGAYIKWQPVDNAQGYIIYYGTAPDKLYQSIMIYSDNEFWFTSMDSQKTYYFTIDTFNENGIQRRKEIKKIE